MKKLFFVLLLLPFFASAQHTVPVKIYYGYKSTATAPTANQIVASTSALAKPNADIDVAFGNTTAAYLWVAYPSTTNGIVSFAIWPLSKTAVGPVNSFGSPVTVGGYKVVISTVPILSKSPIQFFRQ